MSSQPTTDAREGAITPSGIQYALARGDARAVVTEVGAGLRSYSVAGRDVVVAYPADEIMPASHGAVLLPWPNRIGDGRYTFDGVTYQLALTEPERTTAIHGLVCWERWGVLERSESAVALGLDLVPTPGYPFPLRVRITYALGPDGLDIDLTTTNLGTRTAPYGVGFHPWLSPGPDPLDDATLRCDARTWIPTDARLLPAGAEPVPARLDFRTPRRVNGVVLDDGFVDAIRTDGRSWVRLTGADGRTASVWSEAGLDCWQMCSGDDVGAPGYVRTGLAAEPMTCVADAFRTGERVIRLEPGDGHTVRWGLTLS